MANYRNNLPQLSNEIFITDGGIETTLIFHENLYLPDFAAFHLLKNTKGSEALRKYFRTYASLAQKYEVGFVLESPTWRANSDWGMKLGYTDSALADVNHKAIELVSKIRNEFQNETTKMVISGCIGPRGDGYNPTDVMTAKEAEQYHTVQIQTFSETDADMITALTMNYVEEAIGIALAAKSTNMPVVIFLHS
jgi:S-methylmethionine-dependent homocysteine/selenocysteine methylase